MESSSPPPSTPPAPQGSVSVWSSRARLIHERIRGLDGDARRDALDRECGRDWTLNAEVLARLAHDAQPSLEAGRPPSSGHGPIAPPVGELAADAIPGYQLGKLIGIGGAGAVYEATQESPRRAVALKVFHAHRADERQRRRIAHEAEVLARLQHPSIAQVFAVHVGSADRGDRAWIAMELVHGVPIDAWCREQGSTLRERVELLANVAEAVAHAHASGVIHRDLKPSNVLVTDAGVPKVVDFGVARTFGDAPVVGTLHTRDGDLIGTLAYMAAEQVEGASSLVDTRTDVHALGVLGFELLTGKLPREPEWMTLPEWAQATRKPAPSLQLLLPSAPADLSLVVAKALDPERDRRYPTAQAFADDLRRFLKAEPIHARPPTSGYLLRSLVRRHRTLVLGALATVLALTAGLVVSLRLAIESNQQRRRADQEAREAHREAYRAQISVASEAHASGNAPGARTALDRAPESLRGLEWRLLDARIDRTAKVVRYEAKLQRWLSVTPDGSRVAGGGPGSTALVIDANTGEVLRRLPASPEIERGAMLADGRRLVVARKGGRLDVVDVATGAVRELGVRPGCTEECDALCTSATGSWVGESRHTCVPRLRITNVDTGETRLRASVDNWSWGSVAFDPSARTLVASVGDGRILTLDATTDAPARTCYQHPSIGFAASFDPSGRYIATGGSDRRAMVFDVEGGDAATPEVLALHQQDVRSTAWSDDGALVASWAGERVLRVFTAADRRLLLAIPAPDVEEKIVRLRFSSDRTTVEAFDGSSRHTWFTATDTDLDVLRGHRTNAEGNPYAYIYGVAFSPDGRRVATGGWDGTIRVVSVATCRTLAVLTTPGPIQGIAWSPDGDTIVAAGRPNHVTSFDARTGRRIAMVDDGTHEMHTSVAFTRDGSRILSNDYPNAVVARDAKTLARRGERIGAGDGAGFSLRTGADDALLVGYHDGSWARYEADGYARRVALPSLRGGITHVAISPDGSLVAAASEDGTARLCDACTGALRAEITGHVGRVYAVAFSPDGSRLATGGDDGTVRLHDTVTGEEMLVLRGHTSYVFDLAFSPDGTTIASASGDNTARLWSTNSLAERVTRREAALAAEASVELAVRAALAHSTDAESAVGGLVSRREIDESRRGAALDVALRVLAAPAPVTPGR